MQPCIATPCGNPALIIDRHGILVPKHVLHLRFLLNFTLFFQFRSAFRRPKEKSQLLLPEGRVHGGRNLDMSSQKPHNEIPLAYFFPPSRSTALNFFSRTISPERKWKELWAKPSISHAIFCAIFNTNLTTEISHYKLNVSSPDIPSTSKNITQ